MRHRRENIAMLLAALLWIAPVQAHLFAPSLLKIVETAPQSYTLVWKTPLDTPTGKTLVPEFPAHCTVSGSSPAVVEGSGRVLTDTLQCDASGGGLVGHTLGISGLAQNRVSALLTLTLRDGRFYQELLNGERPAYTVPAEAGSGQVMRRYAILGMGHIATGVDHLMFVFGLLLLVGGGARLMGTITAFTLGHSVTLVLAALGLVTYPVAVIEFAIAISVFVLALELAKRDAPDDAPGRTGLLRRYPWWLAGGFGLLHGLGFAGALTEIGLPEGALPLALLFFNLGIELGQVAFVLMMLAGAWLLRRSEIGTGSRTRTGGATDRLASIPVYLLGSLSAMWCLERGLALLR